MTATTTPLQVLPSFVEVLGKKIDKIQLELDSFKFSCVFELTTIDISKAEHLCRTGSTMSRLQLQKRFLDTFGRKPKHANHKTWQMELFCAYPKLSNLSPLASRLQSQVKNVLQQMEACYEKLALQLSQATVAPDSISEILVRGCPKIIGL